MMRRLFLLLAATFAVGCSLEPPFERSNPFDPGSPYEMRLVGVPDTLGYKGARFTAVIDRDPPMPTVPLLITWSAYDPRIGSVPPALPPPSALVLPLGAGEFMLSEALTAELVTTSIAARLNSEVVVGRNMVVGQLVDTLRLACGTVSAPVACSALPLRVGGTLNLRSSARDAGGAVVQGLQFAMERANVTLRTPGVLTPTFTPNTSGTYTFTAAGAGTTWIVIRSDRAVDSVQVTVTP